MDASEISNIVEGHYRLSRAIEEALAADKTLIDESDRWLPRLWYSDIQSLEVNFTDQTIIGYGDVYTMQTGGSTEQVNFTIPLETLQKYL